MKVNSFFEIPEFNQQHHSKDVLDLLHFFASSMNNRFVTFFMYLYTHILCMCNCDTNHDQQANWPNTFDIDFLQSRIRKKSHLHHRRALIKSIVLNYYVTNTFRVWNKKSEGPAVSNSWSESKIAYNIILGQKI